ncbi:MAG: M56 family metallopeptidase [Gemmatimonadota bacterium]
MTLSAWLVYALTVSLLLAVAGWCLDRGLTRLRVPTRWVWAGALGLSIVLPIWALASVGEAVPEEPGAAVSAEVATGGALDQEVAVPGLFHGGAWPVLLLEGGVQRLTEGMARLAALAPSGPRIHRWLAGLWLAGSGAVALLLLASARTLHRQKRRWPRFLVRSRAVRIAPTVGPAVVGVRRPEIVLPHWARRLADQEMEMILTHEEEHIRARDPLLLAAALGAVTLAPWNPALWWQIRRLRDAVEVDCDRRVLLHGTGPRSYGELLVHLGGGGRLDLMPIAALAGSPSLLERRLNAMKKQTLKRTLPTALAGAILAMGLVVVACQTDVPTAAEEEIEAASSEAAPSGIIAEGGGELGVQQWIIERGERTGFEVSGETFEVSGETVNLQGRAGSVRKMERDESAGIDGDRPHRVIFRGESSFRGEAPLYIIDGVPVPFPPGEPPSLDIDTKEIEEVSVLKGAAATALYGPDAQHGAIIITTRAGAAEDGSDPRSP